MNEQLAFLLLALASTTASARAAGARSDNLETLRGEGQVVPPISPGRRSLKGGPNHIDAPPPAPSSPVTSSPTTCVDAGAKCKNAPCCTGLACTGNGGGATCAGYPESTPPPTSKPAEVGQCPPCIAQAFGNGGCGCVADWSNSSLECVDDPTPSELVGYSSSPLYDTSEKLVVKGTTISTNTFSSGYACHDGRGGYYSGAPCYFAHGSVCTCEDGSVWTNANMCLPLVCDPAATPDRCACTQDKSC